MVKLYVISLCMLVSSCAVVYPDLSENQNTECDLVTRQLTLDMVDFGPNGGDATVTKLLSGLVTGVVSGSLAVVGNTVYWLEEYGTCDKSDIDDALTGFNILIQDLNGWFASSIEEVSTWFSSSNLQSS